MGHLEALQLLKVLVLHLQNVYILREFKNVYILRSYIWDPTGLREQNVATEEC